MTTSIISASAKRVTGINVFTLPPERHTELLDTLRAINAEIIRQALPMNVSANFHRAIGGNVVLNYNQYTDRENIHILRSIPETAPLRKRTHDLSDAHEIRWYDVADVIASRPGVDRIEIANDGGYVAVIGILTVKPGKQEEFLALFKQYGETLNGLKAPGFLGLATHRGWEPAYVATYEQWQTADAYNSAQRLAPVAAAAKQISELTEEGERRVYQVLDVVRFDLAREASARAAAR
jgi:quinol monooxygenase YgiN